MDRLVNHYSKNSKKISSIVIAIAFIMNSTKISVSISFVLIPFLRICADLEIDFKLWKYYIGL